MADFAAPLDSKTRVWRCGREVASSEFKKATQAAFRRADRIDQTAREEILTSFFDDRRSMLEHSWILYQQNRPVGACMVSRRHYLSRDRLSPYVDLVAVDPDAQRRGIATALLQKSGLSLWEAGFRDVICAHIRRENTASVRLFRRHGFLLWQKDC